MKNLMWLFLILAFTIPASSQTPTKQLQLRRGLCSNLPTLADGEPAWCEDTQKLYIGQAVGGNFLLAPASGGSGTVTSVGITVPSFLSVTGSPVTAAGTFAVAYSGTALPTANGGTNVTLAGTAGNVLTSDGTNWTSAPPAASGANTALSNLVTTSINQTLQPNSPGAFNLGASSAPWGSVFASLLYNSSGNLAIQLNGMQLRNSVNATVVDWSGSSVSFASQTIVNVADPVNPTDAATKNYVDTKAAPSGTLCGWYDSVATSLIQTCIGDDPSVTCPTGYTQKTTTGAIFCAAN
jgi:major tropism determinant Mtd-like protein